MELKLLSKTKDKFQIIVSDIDITYINSLRRFMSFEVPTLAIEEIEFFKNNSILYDEIVAHRLGLIPLKTDLKSYNLQSECKCAGAGCAQCTLKFSLKATGPKTVYASELKSKDPKVKPVYPQMPIVKLLQDQDIAFEATAVLGLGKEHAKWSPGLIYYKHVPKLIIKKQPENKKEIVESCPKKIFEIKNDTLIIDQKKVYDCDLCEQCIELSGAIEIKKEDEYIFCLESWGQLSPDEIVAKAIDVFNDQLKEFDKLIKEIKL